MSCTLHLTVVNLLDWFSQTLLCLFGSGKKRDEYAYFLDYLPEQLKNESNYKDKAENSSSELKYPDRINHRSICSRL